MTKAEVKVSPVYEIYGTKYPVLDMNHRGLHPLLVSFRRAVSSINPFAHQQVPTSDSMALGPRDGNSFYKPDEYPNSIVWDRGFPSHYDPLKHPRRPRSDLMKQDWGTTRSEPGFFYIQLPRGCIRQKTIYKRCLIANGDDKSKCAEEGQNILEICPTWVLDDMRLGKRQADKAKAIDNLQYREAMTVGPYNIGRTVGNISKKTSEDMSADKLRPDTMWADDRYADITQQEINEAKLRVAKRKEEKAAKQINQEVPIHATHENYHNLPANFDWYSYRPTPEDIQKSQHYDWIHIDKSKDKPLYPS